MYFDYSTASFEEVKEHDIEYIRDVLIRLKNDLSFDEDYYGWLIWNEKPLTEYFFEEENTILNPKELEGYMEDIIEKELKLKRK